MAQVKVKIPKLGLTIETAQLTEWHVAVGDAVTAGQVIGQIEADKASYEIEAPVAGTVSELLFEPSDDEIDVGSIIAVIQV